MTKVMIVDDLPENLYMLQSLLTGNGYEVVLAKNGKEALDLAVQSHPDLIISDILMPVMDGFSLCRRWKQDPELRSVPFVFYTATYTEPEDEGFALSIGADLFIRKPAETDVFLASVGEALNRYSKAGSRSTAVGSSSETAYLKEYNEALIRKLEDKMVQLESANRALAIKDLAIKSSISAIIMTDVSGNLTYVNDSFSNIWGYTNAEIYSKRLDDLVKDPSALRFLSRDFKRTGGWFGEVEARRKDGSVFTALVAAHSIIDRGHEPVGLMASCIDVTEQKRMQEELQRIQKLESLNIFAGGIAHDFNNLLTGLFGSIQMARLELRDDSPAVKHLDVAAEVFERAKDLTQRLLTYAKGRPGDLGEVSVGEIVRDCCTLSLSGSHIHCRLELADGLWTVRGDANQLSQVFNNILINARQAMKEGGNITVRAENCILEAGEVGRLSAGKYIMVAITDEGEGIPDNVLPKIFDPFFTTKAEGTGLGLATSYAIMKCHSGHIGVVSAEEMGSTFTAWLPAYSGVKAALCSKISTENVHGAGRILVMDDEEVICDVVTKMLQSGGYDVVTVANGEDAVEAFGAAVSSGKPFAAVVLDMTIRGGKGGIETASTLLRMDPNAAILISSGYAHNDALSRLSEKGNISLIPKPYLLHELLGAVKAAIARGLSTHPWRDKPAKG